jgi:prophage antirepressor-like protein
VVLECVPWFVAADVAHALGLDVAVRGVGHYLKRLHADERNTGQVVDGKRGSPNKVIVSESGLYKLILRSDKPEARAFRDWVTREVLPAIRKDGA